MIVENSYSRVDVRKLAAAGVKRFFQLWKSRKNQIKSHILVNSEKT